MAMAMAMSASMTIALTLTAPCSMLSIPRPTLLEAGVGYGDGVILDVR